VDASAAGAEEWQDVRMTTNSNPSFLRPTPEEAFATYEALVAANREQVERQRELQPPSDGDFWADRAPRFRPGEMDAPEADALLALAQPADTWMDIGAGGGRFAIPLAKTVRRVVAVEPSPAMRQVMAESAAASGVTNIEAIEMRWPPPPSRAPEPADGTLAANVIYDAHDLREFLEAMEAATRRVCVVITSDRAPSTPDAAIWEGLYGEPLHALPGLREFVAVLGALGRRYDVRTYPVAPPPPMNLDRAVEESRWRYWIGRGTEREATLRELLRARYSQADGMLRLPPRRNYSAAVWWEPAR
jgi:SAM-dependent methyltransferase